MIEENTGLRLLDWTKTTTLRILWEERDLYPILKNKLRRMVPRKLQKTDKLCGFYAIYSAFFLFKFFQKDLNNVHDVHVLSFISNFM